MTTDTTIDKWDLRFLALAKHIAQWSKDPSTKTGAVIVDEDRRIVSTGYNGFPKGMQDLEERYADRGFKYPNIIHCERNAMLFAHRSLKGCTLYTWPFASCTPCAAMVTQSGIVRCVAPTIPPHLMDRWGKDLVETEKMFKECKLAFDLWSGVIE